ncbi:hypothetical protein F4604DRAFT_1957314 [Suillus subluteus]|nr:hypothetical protein F4604DRAFT_1957314 [Suillus subluteus]
MPNPSAPERRYPMARPRKSIHYLYPTRYTGTRSCRSQVRLHTQLPRYSSMAHAPTLPPSQRRPPPTNPNSLLPPIHESELLSSRTLAITRYRRNHELMEEVFRHAAFAKPSSSKRIYEGFEKAELEAQTAKLQDDVGALQAKVAERTAQKVAADDVIVTASGYPPMELTT